MQSARHQFGPSHNIVRPPWSARHRRTLYMTIWWLTDNFFFLFWDFQTHFLLGKWGSKQKKGLWLWLLALGTCNIVTGDMQNLTCDMWHIENLKNNTQLLMYMTILWPTYNFFFYISCLTVTFSTLWPTDTLKKLNSWCNRQILVNY